MRATLFVLVATLALAGPAFGQVTTIDPGEPGEEPTLLTMPTDDYGAVGATPGLRVVRSGKRAHIVFDPAAAQRFRKIDGGRVVLACAYADHPERTSTVPDVLRLIRVPKRRSAFRVAVDPRRDVCRIASPISREDTVVYGVLIGSVALTPWGSTILTRLQTATRMGDVKSVAFDRVLSDGVWPPVQTTIAEADMSDIVALATPDAEPPPAPKIGVFSDGAGRFTLRARAADGFVLFSDHNGDTDLTNLIFWLNAHL